MCVHDTQIPYLFSVTGQLYPWLTKIIAIVKDGGATKMRF